MHKLLPMLFLCCILLVLSACREDDESQRSIEGAWIRSHAVTNVPVRITFFGDGTLLFEPVVQTDLHTASSANYTFQGSELTIFGDNDCAGIEGKYAVVVTCDTIEISVKEDACTPRGAAMSGRWMRE